MSSAHLIVGLGNPGPEYTQTRHNAGFMAIEYCSHQWGITGKSEKKFNAIVGSGFVTPNNGSHCKVILAQPLTYMNKSGESVRGLADYYDIPPEQILVIVDDLALPLGKLRLRGSGSEGGHNGLKSISQHLGTKQYPRLRLGIGQPKDGFQTANHQVGYVLGKFSNPEQSIFNDILETTDACCRHWLVADITDTMSQFNGVNHAPVAQQQPVKRPSTSGTTPTDKLK